MGAKVRSFYIPRYPRALAHQRKVSTIMKRLIALCLLSLFAVSCLPTPNSEDETRNQIIERSFRCMWSGDCN